MSFHGDIGVLRTNHLSVQKESSGPLDDLLFISQFFFSLGISKFLSESLETGVADQVLSALPWLWASGCRVLAPRRIKLSGLYHKYKTVYYHGPKNWICCWVQTFWA